MSTNQIKLSQACEGMIRYKQATGKSDPPIASVKHAQMVDFFVWLQQEYVTNPDGVAPRGTMSLSAKTVLNIHTNLSALWHWAMDEGLVKKNIICNNKTKP